MTVSPLHNSWLPPRRCVEHLEPTARERARRYSMFAQPPPSSPATTASRPWPCAQLLADWIAHNQLAGRVIELGAMFRNVFIPRTHDHLLAVVTCDSTVDQNDRGASCCEVRYLSTRRTSLHPAASSSAMGSTWRGDVKAASLVGDAPRWRLHGCIEWSTPP